jgi:hypothetical protein
VAKSEAIRHTESKDLYSLNPSRGEAGNFRIAVRFFDDHDAELTPTVNRAPESSYCRFKPRSGERMQPTAQAGGSSSKCTSSEGAKEAHVRTTFTLHVATKPA